MNKCPYCGSEIEPKVLKCRHCGEWLDESHRKKAEDVQKAQVETGRTAKLIGWTIAILLILGAIAGMCNR